MIDGTLYRHKKRGSVYVVLTHDALWEAEAIPATVYQCIETKQVWVRPSWEFLDGRFELIALPTPPEDAT